MASYTEDSLELMKTMGKNIRECREERGLSQSQLGKAISSNQPYISNIENGYGNKVNCTKLYSIAQTLEGAKKLVSTSVYTAKRKKPRNNN